MLCSYNRRVETEFTWDAEKAMRDLRKHGVSFETAKQVFFDSWIARTTKRKSSASFQQERQTSMSGERTPVSLRKGIKITDETRALSEQRDRSLDNDPDAPTLPPERWANAMRRDELFRPIKQLTSVGIDVREKMTSERGL
jgi:hypothetical protein